MFGAPRTPEGLFERTAMPPPKGRKPKSARGDRAKARPPAQADPVVGDQFFRAMVASMRNGVLAIWRDGRMAFMNEVASRTLGCPFRPSDIGRPFFDVA